MLPAGRPRKAPRQSACGARPPFRRAPCLFCLCGHTLFRISPAGMLLSLAFPPVSCFLFSRARPPVLVSAGRGMRLASFLSSTFLLILSPRPPSPPLTPPVRERFCQNKPLLRRFTSSSCKLSHLTRRNEKGRAAATAACAQLLHRRQRAARPRCRLRRQQAGLCLDAAPRCAASTPTPPSAPPPRAASLCCSSFLHASTPK